MNRPLAALEAGSNTEKAVSNDEKAVSNGKKAVSNGKKAVSNDEKAVSSGKKAVSKKEKNEQKLLAFCKEPKTLSEICEHLGMTDKYKVKKRYIDPLLNKSLRMTEPESPKSPTQKYVAI
ncbi:hypothetical protein L6471_02010 [Segatella bryantii]|uniref:Fic family protein n=1 Tax=Segatella bryantii TaxID=77095 RepID=UPI001EDB0751|nr:hypothetical protein [Segatella bryantii]UKK75264.1 hypothetical protein L6471_02010 [Segatella bryantii]